MTKVRSSICSLAPASLALWATSARCWPAVSLNRSSFDSAGVAGASRGATGGSPVGAVGADGRGACSSPGASAAAAFFACLRIFTRSTMALHAMLASGGGDARGIDRRGVFAERVEQRGGGQRVDQARDAAAHHVNFFHRFVAERIALAARDADAVLDVADRLFE